MFKKLLALFLAFSFSFAPTPQNEAKAFMLGGYAPSLTCPYTPPLDANSAQAAYGFRKLRTAYAGNAVLLQRASDSATQNIGFAANGCDFDVSTATTFCAATTCSVKTWYDQSTNSTQDVTNATLANQPTVTLSCQNGQPCGVYNGTSQFLAGTLASSVGATTFALVAKDTSLAATRFAAVIGASASGTSGNSIGYITSNGCSATRTNAGFFIGVKSCTVNTWYRWIGTLNTTLSSIYLNGVKGTDVTTSAAPATSTQFHIGRDGNTAGTGWWIGSISEVIVFSPDLSITDSNTVSSNQGSYWGL